MFTQNKLWWWAASVLNWSGISSLDHFYLNEKCWKKRGVEVQQETFLYSVQTRLSSAGDFVVKLFMTLLLENNPPYRKIYPSHWEKKAVFHVISKPWLLLGFLKSYFLPFTYLFGKPKEEQTWKYLMHFYLENRCHLQVEFTAKPSPADSPVFCPQLHLQADLNREYPETSILCFNLSLSLTMARHTQSRVLF